MLVRCDIEEVSLTSLPESIGITRGRLEVSFRSVEHLAESLLVLAHLLGSEGEEFVREFEPLDCSTQSESAEEMNVMLAELEAAEQRFSSP